MNSEPDKTKPKTLIDLFVIGIASFVFLGGGILFLWTQHRLTHLGPYGDPCISQLKQIDGAKASWADDRHITNESTVVPMTELFGKTNYISDVPTCPQGGTYQIGLLGQKPRCSLPGHTP